MACEFSELIKNARHEAGLTQAQLAGKLNVSEKTVSAWECGANQIPVPDVMDSLYHVLGLTVSDICDAVFGPLKFPHLIPEAEFEERLRNEPFLGSNDNWVRSMIKRRRQPDTGMCWDYILTMRRKDLELCRAFMNEHPGADIFEADRKFLDPLIWNEVRRNPDKGETAT